MKLKAVISAALACLMLGACGKNEAPLADMTVIPAEYNEEAPLICSAASQEEAEAIAAQYGISLVEFSYGIASFYTDEDPQAVIQRGIEQGWTELSMNLLNRFE